MRTQAVIFDVDGTLVDTVRLHAQAWSRAFGQFGVDVSADAAATQIGKGGDQLMPVFLKPEQLQEDGKAIEKARGEIFKRDYLGQAEAFPMVRDLVLRLKAEGVRIAIASSCKPDELDAYLTLANITGLPDVSTTSADAERSKPYPDIFEAALGKLGQIDRSAVIVIGDSPYDAEAAVKAGLTPIGVLCGGFPEADLRHAGCVAIYHDPADLLDHVEELIRL